MKMTLGWAHGHWGGGVYTMKYGTSPYEGTISLVYHGLLGLCWQRLPRQVMAYWAKALMYQSNQGVITPWSNNHQWVVLDTELLHSRPWATLPMPVVEPVPTIYCLSNSFLGLWMNDTLKEKFGPAPRFGLQVSKINQCWPQDQKVVDPNTMVVPLSDLSSFSDSYACLSRLFTQHH